MRAKEFIIEADFNNVELHPDNQGKVNGYIEQVAAVIRKDCGPFIHANLQDLRRQRYMYRGVKGAQTADIAISGNVRTDRTPRDTPLMWHTILDNFFQHQFGWKYRSAALFATNDINNTYDYGRPYIMFPKGEYKICYSPIVEDVTVDIAGGISKVSTGVSPRIQAIIKAIPNEEIKDAAYEYRMKMDNWMDFFSALMNFTAGRPDREVGEGFEEYFPHMLSEFLLPKLGYEETLHYAEADDSELMIRCSSYYGIRYDRDNMAVQNEILKLIAS